jgi:manganese transport protein
VKRLFAVALGILTAIGGFVDIGDIVAGALVGSRYGLRLTWVLVLGIISICVYAEMAGRVVAISGRPVFDLVRERLGPRFAFANLVGSLLVTLLTLSAEIGGVALTLQLVSGLPYLLWAPPAALVIWLVMWRVKFDTLENLFGLLGLALVVLLVAIVQLHPSWGTLAAQIKSPAPPPDEGLPTYFYYAISLFGAAMTPYEVFFFSSGGVEQGWTRRDLGTVRLNVFVGFPLGGLLSLSIAATAAILLFPANVQVATLAQMALPTVVALGQVGLFVLAVGIFAATFGAALEAGLSTGYSLAQFFGWRWGKGVRPRQDARFHTALLLAVVLGAATVLTSIDPIKITEYSLVFSAIALPLTYLPILLVANDRDYMGDKVNGKLANTLGGFVLLIVMVVSVTGIPLMLLTKAGQ